MGLNIRKNEYRHYQTEDLKLGLSLLPKFQGKICEVCEGEGQHEQVYNAGCGQGYYRSQGPCDYCKGTGLLVFDVAATQVNLAQVLTAAERHKETEHEPD